MGPALVSVPSPLFPRGVPCSKQPLLEDADLDSEVTSYLPQEPHSSPSGDVPHACQGTDESRLEERKLAA